MLGKSRGERPCPLADHIEAEIGWRSAWSLLDSLIDPDEPHEDLELEAQQAEDMLFDLIEYFHRHVSEGVDDDGNRYHSWSNCGWHYQEFDPAPARALFRQRMNRTLMNYRGGFQINEGGQVEQTADEGLDQLIDAALPTKDPDIAKRVAGAIALTGRCAHTGGAAPNASHSSTSHSQLLRWWAWPLPPSGPLEFICQWPIYGIGDTRVGIDAQLILDSGRRSVQLWPEDEG